ILHRYGERLQGELRWKGMVIGASEGTEVKAIADGRVILADWLPHFGEKTDVFFVMSVKIHRLVVRIVFASNDILGNFAWHAVCA
ncbi:hypothetical protein ONJ16_26420, partial [Salmonella enterica subsp. enterica serovar Montevideo]|nr:hypothetical protein [Salmonella enterica subsp. enterica serovar Montevideo]